MREYNISVPQTISKRPASDFFVSFSLNTKYEKTIDIRISLSVFLMPHLANTEVNPAKTAERTAAVSHNTVIHAPPQIPVYRQIIVSQISRFFNRFASSAMPCPASLRQHGKPHGKPPCRSGGSFHNFRDKILFPS